jgi:O-antigen ligase
MFSRIELATIGAMVLGLAYFYCVPVPVLALPGLLLFAVLAWSRLDMALALLPLTFPFWYVPKRLFGDKVFPLSEIVLALCVVLALVQLVLGLRRGNFSPISPASIRAGLVYWRSRLGGYISAGVLLLLVGVSVGVVGARRQPEALRAWRWEIAEPLVYFALLLTCGPRRRTVWLLVWSFLGSALLVSILAAVQVLWLHVTFLPIADDNRLIHTVTTSGVVPRATAIIYGSANSLGTWLARTLPLALALALASTARRWVRLVAGVLVLAYLPALIWSGSRGAWVAVAASALVVVWLTWPRVRKPALGIILLGIAIVIWRHTALLDSLLLAHGDSGEVRGLVWLASWHMIQDHWLVGIGPDQFLYYYSPHYTQHPYWIPRLNGRVSPAADEPNLAQPHNLLLDFWLSGGILALAGLIALLVGMARLFGYLWRRSASLSSPELPLGPLALGVAASVLAGVVHGMVDESYFLPDLALAFWWALALLLLLREQGDGESDGKDGKNENLRSRSNAVK